ALDIYIEYGDRFSQARTLHNLGSIAQQLKEFQQAREYYQQALDIYIEYGDRYSQASSYFQLGKVAEELEELEQAKSCYLKDLEFSAESNDEHGLNITLSNLARFYQKTQDNSLITEVATMFDVTEAEVKELFEKFNAENQ
ncbi:MAG: tetratricopeptide repeat protein, partial [Waterburya sp.]